MAKGRKAGCRNDVDYSRLRNGSAANELLEDRFGFDSKYEVQAIYLANKFLKPKVGKFPKNQK